MVIDNGDEMFFYGLFDRCELTKMLNRCLIANYRTQKISDLSGEVVITLQPVGIACHKNIFK